MKKCTKCGEQKPLSEFYKQKTKKDGLMAHCKACAKIQSAAWYKINSKKVILRTTKWSKNNPEKKAKNCKKSSRKKEIWHNF